MRRTLNDDEIVQVRWIHLEYKHGKTPMKQEQMTVGEALSRPCLWSTIGIESVYVQVWFGDRRVLLDDDGKPFVSKWKG